MSTFQRKYTDEQRDAMIEARLGRGLKLREVAALAATGELTGERFEVRVNYIGKLCAHELKRRAGRTAPKLADKPPRDALEIMRRRWLSLAEYILDEAERKRKAKTLTVQEVAGAARVLKEMAAIPGPDDPRPVKPGDKIPGTQQNNGGPTRHGLAGAMLEDMRRNGPDAWAERDTNHKTETVTENADAAQHSASDDEGSATRQDDAPDSSLSDEVAAILSSGLTGA